MKGAMLLRLGVTDTRARMPCLALTGDQPGEDTEDAASDLRDFMLEYGVEAQPSEPPVLPRAAVSLSARPAGSQHTKTLDL